ncbi:LamB/YcsF family protein [Streptomyces sp. NPDC020996]|uniref:LamB/YcsF family protein n=1 Tax=Streptomyces sp. NPDC020996 TaxID=3154791 RepID=UPI0033D1EEC0
MHVLKPHALSSCLRDDAAAGLARARAVHALPSDVSYDDNSTLLVERKIIRTEMDYPIGQVRKFLKSGQVHTEAATLVNVTAGSICVHGDGGHAVELAAAVRQTVADAGVPVEGVAA